MEAHNFRGTYSVAGIEPLRVLNMGYYTARTTYSVAALILRVLNMGCTTYSVAALILRVLNMGCTTYSVAALILRVLNMGYYTARTQWLH